MVGSGARRAWIEGIRPILVAGAWIGLCLAAFRLGVLPAIVGLLDPPEPWPTIVRRSGTVASLLLGYAVHAGRRAPRRPSALSAQPLAIGLGGISGAVLVGLPIALLYHSGHYRVVSVGDLSAVIDIGSLILGAAIFEEVIFRGVIFAAWERWLGTLAAIAVQSLLFSVLHVSNGNLDALWLLSGVLIGGMWTLIYVLCRNLWVIAVHHAAWNFVIFATGLPLSGLHDWRARAPLQSEPVGGALWTGGAGGPEGSVLIVAVVAVAIGALWRWARRRGCVAPAPVR